MPTDYGEEKKKPERIIGSINMYKSQQVNLPTLVINTIMLFYEVLILKKMQAAP